MNRPKKIIITFCIFFNFVFTLSASASKQIKALFDNRLDGGYMTWNAYSAQNNLKKYKNQKEAGFSRKCHF